MKIYSMTATFGKLEHETLILQPGLNIIEAPNEWGKSTWCAFLVAMLYGMDTRAHTTKTALADKERYAPWSGAPMSGRVDLNWNGRDITIERRTRGRSVFGDFKAYETATGLPIPELTAANCGQTLLGVEKNAFTRAGFLKLTDLPVTQDDALRRRLNALVTTGDESGAGDTLAQKLKDLKNRCRFNRSGLIPQAEAQRDELTRKLRELAELQERAQQFRQRQEALDADILALNNHKAALDYAEAQESRRQIDTAAAEKETAAARLRAAEEACSGLPSKDELQETIQSLHTLQQQSFSLQAEVQGLTPAPQAPKVPAPFQGLSPKEALSTVKKDTNSHNSPGAKTYLPWLIVGLLSIGAAAGLLLAKQPAFAAIPLALLLICAATALRIRKKRASAQEGIEMKYGSADPAVWLAMAERYAQEQRTYEEACAARDTARLELECRQREVADKLSRLTNGADPAESLAAWQRDLAAHAELADAVKDHQRSVSLLAVAQAMARDVPAPQAPDELTFSGEETDRRLSDALYEQRQLHMKLGQCIGQMDRLGDKDAIASQLAAVNARIERLEDTYAALSIAQQTLTAATAELQRRFAPRISQRAQALFAQLTGGRYDRLTLSEDLSLNAGAQDEDTLRSSLWRSDGTVDQLYLALRLAVAGELTPDAPLILDDALVRFDDRRLAAAMDILRKEAENKQVILFTCQGREKQY